VSLEVEERLGGPESRAEFHRGFERDLHFKSKRVPDADRKSFVAARKVAKETASRDARITNPCPKFLQGALASILDLEGSCDRCMWSRLVDRYKLASL